MAWMAVLGLLAACAPPSPVVSPTPGSQTISGSRGGQTGSPPVATTAPLISAAPEVRSTGRVLGSDGKPVANVRVRGFVASETGPAAFALRQTGLETLTDANGRFNLVDPEKRVLNLEASDGESRKAIAFSVAFDATGVELRMVAPGSFSGRVTAPRQPDVSDLSAVDVFIPGTPYAVKADAEGRFTLSGLPVADRYEIVASQAELGQARATGQALKAGGAVLLTDLELSPVVPVVTSLFPTAGGPGATVTLKGLNFGDPVLKRVSLTLGGVALPEPERPDPNTLRFKVPKAAASGDVVVTVGDLKSPPTPFKVVQALAINTTPSEMLVGDTGAYAVVAKDTKGALLTGIALEWAVEGDAVKVDGSGIVTALKAGTATVIGRSGELESRVVVRVQTLLAVVDPAAGTGVSGQLDGKGGAAGVATFTGPLGLAPDGAGFLLVADGARVRKVAVRLPSFDVTEVASAGLLAPGAIAVRDGVAWVSDLAGFSIQRIALRETGQPVTKVAGSGVAGFADGVALDAKLGGITGLAVGPDGTLYMADPDNHRIRTLSPGGVVRTLVGQGTTGGRANGDAAAARFSGPRDVCFDAKASPPCLYVADTGNHLVRRVVLESGGARVETVAGSGVAGQLDGPAAEATFMRPTSLALGADGHLLIGDDAPASALLRWVDLEAPDNAVSTLAGGPLVEGGALAIDGAGRDVRFAGIGDLAADQDGLFYVSDPAGRRVRRLTLRRAP